MLLCICGRLCANIYQRRESELRGCRVSCFVGSLLADCDSSGGVSCFVFSLPATWDSSGGVFVRSRMRGRSIVTTVEFMPDTSERQIQRWSYTLKAIMPANRKSFEHGERARWRQSQNHCAMASYIPNWISHALTYVNECTDFAHWVPE